MSSYISCFQFRKKIFSEVKLFFITSNGNPMKAFENVINAELELSGLKKFNSRTMRRTAASSRKTLNKKESQHLLDSMLHTEPTANKNYLLTTEKETIQDQDQAVEQGIFNRRILESFLKKKLMFRKIFHPKSR